MKTKNINNKHLNFGSDNELADFLMKNVTESLRQAVKVTVKTMIKQEMEKLREEINEKLSFNGYYDKNMISSAGKMNIPVPRFRETPMSELPLSSMNIFDQEKENFLKIVSEMHRLGISQRKVANLCHTCFGISISKNRVGKIHRELAKKEELQINSKPVTDEYEYLLLDGIWAKMKNYGLGKDNKTVMLCALGVKPNGQREIIAFKLAFKEDTENWINLLIEIKKRGLTGNNLKLIIADDNGGLIKALKTVYLTVPLQICIAHKMRNVINNVSWKNKKSLGEDLKLVYQMKTKGEAQKTADTFCRKWFVQEEKAVRSLRFDFEKTLTYLEFPEEIWKQIRTTNILEREFREVRRRIKVFDNSFNGPESMTNYANSIFSYLNEHYPANHLHTKS